jgi:hypothetical protein
MTFSFLPEVDTLKTVEEKPNTMYGIAAWF